jgi:hypothetical protein
MSGSKIAQLALYIVAGISVLVIAFFYFGDNLIDSAAYEAKLQKMNAPETVSFNYIEDMAPETDTVSQEALTEGTEVAEEMVAAEGELTEPEAIVEEVVTEPVKTEDVKLSFMERLVSKKTDIAIGWAYILVIVTLLVSLAFSLLQMFSNTKALIRGLIFLVGIAILVGIAYMLGSDTPLKIIGYEGTDNSDPQVLKMVDMGLIFSYFVLGGVFISILYSEIAKYFK